MKPLNTQERTKQFFIFLGFFVVTMALVIGVVYFDFDNPNKQNKVLLEKKKELEIKQRALETRSADADSILNLINTIRTQSSSIMLNNISNAETYNSQLRNSIRNDSILRKTLLNSYFDLSNSALIILRDYQKAKSDVEEFITIKTELKECKDDLKKLQEKYDRKENCN